MDEVALELVAKVLYAMNRGAARVRWVACREAEHPDEHRESERYSPDAAVPCRARPRGELPPEVATCRLHRIGNVSGSGCLRAGGCAGGAPWPHWTHPTASTTRSTWPAAL